MYTDIYVSTDHGCNFTNKGDCASVRHVLNNECLQEAGAMRFTWTSRFNSIQQTFGCAGPVCVDQFVVNTYSAGLHDAAKILLQSEARTLQLAVEVLTRTSTMLDSFF